VEHERNAVVTECLHCGEPLARGTHGEVEQRLGMVSWVCRRPSLEFRNLDRVRVEPILVGVGPYTMTSERRRDVSLEDLQALREENTALRDNNRSVKELFDERAVELTRLREGIDALRDAWEHHAIVAGQASVEGPMGLTSKLAEREADTYAACERALAALTTPETDK
jgi:hypothetical protein